MTAAAVDPAGATKLTAKERKRARRLAASHVVEEISEKDAGE